MSGIEEEGVCIDGAMYVAYSGKKFPLFAMTKHGSPADEEHGMRAQIVAGTLVSRPIFGDNDGTAYREFGMFTGEFSADNHNRVYAIILWSEGELSDCGWYETLGIAVIEGLSVEVA